MPEITTKVLNLNLINFPHQKGKCEIMGYKQKIVIYKTL